MLRSTVLVICLFAVGGCAGRRADAPQVEFHRIQAADGWPLALHRHLPKQIDPDRLPVILCHGVGLNHRFWDTDPHATDTGVGFADHLAELGWDVWSVDLRGAGQSGRSLPESLRAMFSLNPRRIFDVLNGGTVSLWPMWTIDDHITLDLPAVIDHVKQSTGRPSVAWVGHSMGGMILLGALQRNPRDDVAAAVAVASPLVLPGGKHSMVGLLDRLSAVAVALDLTVSVSPLLFYGAHLSHVQPHPMDGLYFNAAGTEPDVLLCANRQAYEDISLGVILQLFDLLRHGKFRAMDRDFDYTDLRQVTVPTLFIAGRYDNVAPVEGVEHGWSRLGSLRKKLFVPSPGAGAQSEYGHSDLILGRRARYEVWPTIVDWLSRHAREG